MEKDCTECRDTKTIIKYANMYMQDVYEGIKQYVKVKNLKYILVLPPVPSPVDKLLRGTIKLNSVYIVEYCADNIDTLYVKVCKTGGECASQENVKTDYFYEIIDKLEYNVSKSCKHQAIVINTSTPIIQISVTGGKEEIDTRKSATNFWTNAHKTVRHAKIA